MAKQSNSSKTEEHPAEPLPPGCVKCSGSGWQVDEGQNGARRCDCARGRYLREKDRGRVA